MTHAASVRIARRGFSLAALAILVLAGSGCNKLKARDLLNKGVAAFKNGQYDAAVEDFKQAKDLDHSLLNARLYLATAYASQYIPGAPSEENVPKGNQAIAEFKGVLEKDPNNLSAIDGIGSILFQMSGQPFNAKKFEESKTYHQRHIRVEAQRSRAVLLDRRHRLDLGFPRRTPNCAPPIIKTTSTSRSKKAMLCRPPFAPTMSQRWPAGRRRHRPLEKAIQLRPDYDDAMAYLNLLYRRKADMVESADERASYQKQADELVDKVKEIKQKKASEPQPTNG